MQKKAILEKVTVLFSIAVVIGAIWFWSLQVGDVLELLRAAEGG